MPAPSRDDLIALGLRIKSAVDGLGGASRVAPELGVSAEQVRRWARGVGGRPNAQSLARLADMAGIPLGELVGSATARPLTSLEIADRAGVLATRALTELRKLYGAEGRMPNDDDLERAAQRITRGVLEIVVSQTNFDEEAIERLVQWSIDLHHDAIHLSKAPPNETRERPRRREMGGL